MNGADSLLEVRDLRTYFHTDDGVVRAVDGVTFDIAKRQVVGVVGESGCGKSVTALSIMRLIPTPPGRIEEGSILLHRDHETVDIATLPATGKTIRQIRGAEISMIFQEPMRTLSPIYSIGYQIAESVRLHMGLSKADTKEHVINMLRSVGMPDPEQRVKAYPHHLSGGMRQRAMIAMALSCRPKLLNADEPTTALDVTIEAQILELVRDLQREYHMVDSVHHSRSRRHLEAGGYSAGDVPGSDRRARVDGRSLQESLSSLYPGALQVDSRHGIGTESEAGGDLGFGARSDRHDFRMPLRAPLPACS